MCRFQFCQMVDCWFLGANVESDCSVMDCKLEQREEETERERDRESECHLCHKQFSIRNYFGLYSNLLKAHLSQGIYEFLNMRNKQHNEQTVLINRGTQQ